MTRTQENEMHRYLIAATASLAFATAAHAGQQYIDSSGYAASGHDVVAYFDLEQSAVGATQPDAVPGNASITAEYNGATFAFANEENRERFLADPDTFAPQYDGHCAYGVAKGGKVPGNPDLWRIVDDKLYLNITRNVVGFWEDDIPGNLQLSETNWVDIESTPAADDEIPQYQPDAPVN